MSPARRFISRKSKGRSWALTHTSFLKSLSDRFHLRQHQATTSLLTALMSDKTQSNG